MEKVLGVFLLMMTAGTVSANYEFVLNQPERIEKYQFGLEHTLILPTEFAHPFIVNDEQLKQLEGNTVYRVELIYTQFKSSPDFDQIALNRNRVSQVLRLIPQLKSDQPVWSLVEQTGATTRDIANTYFHGFVIHYAQGLDHESLDEFYQSFQKPEQVFTVDNQTGANLKSESGTSIIIPPNAVVYGNGKPVAGKFEITYREFRNPAEIAFSGIPMIYAENGEEYNFSSVGMFELTAHQNDQELHLQQPVTVDFNCTEQKPGVAFYQMDNNGKWKELNKVNFDQANSASAVRIELKTEGNQFAPVGFISRSTGGESRHAMGKKNTTQSKAYDLQMNLKQGNNTSVATMNDQAWNTYQNLKKENDSTFNLWVENDNPERFEVVVNNEYIIPFNHAVMNRRMNNGNVMNKLERGPQPNNMNATLLGGGGDAGHTYPTIVKGLNSPEFGVYNCDQIYRIGDAVALAPTYVNEEGNEIQNKHVACLIDLNYNGAFSFHPNSVTCDRDGRNVLLLFTSDKEVYMIGEQDFAALGKTNQRPVMSMTNVTEKLKTSDDLKQMLGL